MHLWLPNTSIRTQKENNLSENNCVGIIESAEKVGICGFSLLSNYPLGSESLVFTQEHVIFQEKISRGLSFCVFACVGEIV